MLARPTYAGGPSSGSDAEAQVKSLLSDLKLDLEQKNLPASQRQGLLEKLKVLSRNPANARAVYKQEGIETLSRYALDEESLPVSREALRNLANAFLLQDQSRKIFADLGYIEKAAERLKTDDRDDEFLISRILFLMTYSMTLDFDKLISEHGLAHSVNANIARHSKRCSESSGRTSAANPTEEMSLVETLKLLFNITYYHPGLASKFSDSIPHLFAILSSIKLPSPPLQPPVTYLINALMNLEPAKKESSLHSDPVFPTLDPETNIQRLTSILDQAIKSYPERELDQATAPLFTLLRRVYEIAPPEMQEYMRSLLLPTDDARSKPLGTDDTLASRILRLSVSPSLPTLRENISALLFELSDKDASKFVRNVGYGYAAGFLMNQNIEVPANAMEANAVGSQNEAGTADADLNPVTGQRRSHEPVDTGPEMTDEEKEREAERLFVLFERLRATGVVDVQNPVRQAMEEGRFEELPD